MDVSSLGGVSSALTQGSDAASIAVLKKAMDIQAQSATQLIEALPQVTNNPPNLGNGVDVRA
jgi:hypothetical protein